MHQTMKQRVEQIEESSRKCLKLIQLLLNSAMAILFSCDIYYTFEVIYMYATKTVAVDFNQELLFTLFLSGCIIFLIYRARENVQYLFDFIMQIQALFIIDCEDDIKEDRRKKQTAYGQENDRSIQENKVDSQQRDIERLEDSAEAKMSVLIIDDNAVSRIILRNMLASQPVVIEEAEDGPAGIEILKRKKIDLVFLDYKLPKQDGLEVVREIRQSKEAWSDVRVVGLSACEEEWLKEAFQKEQVECLIKKPFSLEQVLACISPQTKVEEIELTKKDAHLFEEARQRKKSECKESIKFVGQTEQRENIEQSEEIKPDEKIKSSQKTRLQQILSFVNGLQYEDGMKYSMGNEEQYEQILELSISYIKKFILEVPQYVKGEDKEKIEYELHAIRGILSHIGAGILHKQAEETEEQIKIQKIMPAALIEHFLCQITVFQCELEHAICAYNGSERKDVRIAIDEKSEDEIKQLKEQAVFYANNYEYNEMMDMLKLLQGAGKPEWKKSIDQAVAAASIFDYEAVKEMLSDIH